MNKFCGLISGLIGGIVVSLVGVIFVRQEVYVLDAILQTIRGLSVPTYIPLYSLGPSGAYFLIWELVLCLATLVLWVIIGISYGMRIPDKQWSKRRITQAWLLWGLSTPLIYSFFLFIVFWGNGGPSVLKDTSYLTYLIELIIWWSISGIFGGVVSALHSTWRCWNDGV
jgi:hypothetical protein